MYADPKGEKMIGLIDWDWDAIGAADENDPTNSHSISMADIEVLGQFCDRTRLHDEHLARFLEKALYERYRSP